jgi:hypothetical protein
MYGGEHFDEMQDSSYTVKYLLINRTGITMATTTTFEHKAAPSPP